MGHRILNFLKNNRYILIAFFMPVAILVLAFAVCGIFPFGEQQIAVIDMYHQYVPFLGELQYKLQEGGSLFYSWNSGGGGNFWCLMSYYGASPLNILLILFPKALLMEGVTVVLLIKVGLTGSFMFFYLKNVKVPEGFQTDSCGWHTVAFACMYALSSYVIGYYWCIMWMDAVMLLPLIILGLNRLIEDGRMALYTVSLALTVFSNYYIAIMVCIFIMVYYPVLYFIKISGRGALKCFITTLKAIGCSVLAIGMAAVMMLPTYISMNDTYYFASKMPEEWRFYENPIDILNQLLPNAQLTYIEGLPNLCCGLLVTLMLFVYFISKEISLKEKVLNGAVLTFMFFSINVNVLNFIWHGMHFPNQLPYRFSFLICFLLASMAYRGLNRMGSVRKKDIGVIIGGFAAYYIFAQKYMADNVDDVNVFFYYGIAFLAAYGALLTLYKNRRLARKWFAVGLIIIVAAEMSVTVCSEVKLVGNSSRETYNENKSDIMRLAGYAEKVSEGTEDGGDGTFARIELNESIIHNCPALYHYRGLGQFSSTLNADNTALMRHIGLEGKPSGNRFNYNETNPVTNCITNIGYLIGKNCKIDDPDFKLVKKSGYSRLYESKYPLSIGYMLPLGMRAWDGDSNNPFINLDSFVRTATGGAVEKVFIDKGEGQIDEINTVSYYDGNGVIESSLVEGAEDGMINVTYKADSSEKYYVYVETDYAETVTIERQDANDNQSLQSDCGSIVNIGNVSKGEEFSIKVDFDDGKAGRVRCHVCTMDYDSWNKAYKSISRNTMEVTESGDNFIKGRINVKKDGLLVMSVPYEEGWTLKVDGAKREITDLTGGSWITTGLSKGKHEIEISFMPPGFMAGVLISVLSVFILIGLCLLRKRRLNGAIETQACEQLREYPEGGSGCSKGSEQHTHLPEEGRTPLKRI